MFTAGWQSEDPKKRLNAIAKLKPEDKGNQDVLKKLVLEDPDLEVRSAAILKLNQAHAVHEQTQMNARACAGILHAIAASHKGYLKTYRRNNNKLHSST